MVESVRRYRYTDFDNPRYYNIAWLKLLEEADKIIKLTGSVFEVAPQHGFQPAVVSALRKKQGAEQ
jgi:hypothetical protein